MNSDQSQIPLADRLRRSAQSDNVPFHTPGHHKGQGIHPELKTWWGEAIFQADLPELPELDNLFAPNGVIAAAETLAADCWGSDRTFFLTNGSTAGVIASILAVCNPGDSVLVPRNVHRSVISGLILSGANPVFMMPEYDERLGIAHSVRVETIANHLVSNPKIKAVLIVNPTYYGVCSDVIKIANLVHHYNLPLIVDEAHGAHFQFHPALPTAALTAGADVVIQSTHKTLSALTQASMLHIKGDRVSADRLAKSLHLVQSTSPSYLLLASLDIARMQMATQGEILLGQAIDRMKRVRSEINKIPHITTLEFKKSSGFHELDPLRLTVLISGMNGFAADELLHEELGITCELPGLQSLTFIFTHGTTDEDCDRLLMGLQQLSDRIVKLCNNTINYEVNHEVNYEIFTDLPTRVLSPRDAFFAASKLVTVHDAIGLISADLICPYPPGIPIIMPGEQITETAIAYLQQILAAGGMLTGCADSDLQTMRVIDN